MIRRLLLALLTLCLALPAAAMPLAHAMPAAHHVVAADHGHHSRHHQQPDPQAAQHDCIGCIAPYSAMGVVPAVPVPASGDVVPGLANALPDTTAGPDTPPPKP